jgi:hypothetical protein
LCLLTTNDSKAKSILEFNNHKSVLAQVQSPRESKISVIYNQSPVRGDR